MNFYLENKFTEIKNNTNKDNSKYNNNNNYETKLNPI